MAKHPKVYRRLPGRSFRDQRAYLGPDHILSVTSNRFSEDYKRFYFRDIQAFVIRQTTAGRTANFILGGLGLLFLLVAVVTAVGGGGDYTTAIVWTVLSALLLGPCGINALMGPTCVCQVKTAVQIETLPSLGRLWRARKVLQRLRPYIIEAQGAFPTEPAPSAPASPEPPVFIEPPVFTEPAVGGLFPPAAPDAEPPPPPA